MNQPPHPSLPHPLVELILTRLREFFREPGIVFWVFGFPLIMALGLGLAFRSRPPELPRLAVVLDNAPPEARVLADQLLQSALVDATEFKRTDAERSLARAKVDVIVVLGPGTEKTPVSVDYVFDPLQDKSPSARLVADSVLQAAAGRDNPLSTRDESLEKPGSRYIDFLVPGLIGLNLMGSSMWGVGYNLVIARKRKLLKRYGVTPMRRSHFLLSYFLSRAVFLILELAFLITFGSLLFDIVIQGTFAAVALVSLTGAAAFAGISLMIGARIENTEIANGWMNLIQLPMWLLSGTFFSYERFPEFLHLPIQLLPLTALVDALRAVYNDGVALSGLGPQLLVLAAWGGAGFAFAIKAFRWQ